MWLTTYYLTRIIFENLKHFFSFKANKGEQCGIDNMLYLIMRERGLCFYWGREN